MIWCCPLSTYLGHLYDHWGPRLRMVILLLVMRHVWNYVVWITIGSVAPRVYKILPGKSPLFRRFQHQTPFSEGGRGSPVWVKLSSWLNPRVPMPKKIFVEVMTM